MTKDYYIFYLKASGPETSNVIEKKALTINKYISYTTKVYSALFIRSLLLLLRAKILPYILFKG